MGSVGSSAERRRPLPGKLLLCQTFGGHVTHHRGNVRAPERILSRIRHSSVSFRRLRACERDIQYPCPF